MIDDEKKMKKFQTKIIENRRSKIHLIPSFHFIVYIRTFSFPDLQFSILTYDLINFAHVRAIFQARFRDIETSFH